MRKIFVSVVAVLAAAGVTWALNQAAINDTCPVKGTPVKNVTSNYKGKVVAFC